MKISCFAWRVWKIVRAVENVTMSGAHEVWYSRSTATFESTLVEYVPNDVLTNIDGFWCINLSRTSIRTSPDGFGSSRKELSDEHWKICRI